MDKLSITLILLFCVTPRYQPLKIKGTWVNTEIFNAVQLGRSSVDLEQIVPRCIYIDLSNKLTIEYRYEQKSKTSLINRISSRGDSIFFSSLGRNFAVINDSILLLFNYGRAITFKKINSESVIGNGIQALLKNYFWSSCKKWKVIIFKNGRAADTVSASIGDSNFSGDSSNLGVRHYEFTDVRRYSVNGKHLFGVDLFKITNKNMTDSDEVFAIKKSGPFVYLYKGDELFYKLSPIK